VDIVGQAIVAARGGTLELDALAIPYGSGVVEIPRTEDLELEDPDPRDDVRIIVSAGNTGHWTPGPTHTPWVESRRNVLPNPRMDNRTDNWIVTAPTTQTAQAGGTKVTFANTATVLTAAFFSAAYTAVPGESWVASIQVTVPPGQPAGTFTVSARSYGTTAGQATSPVVTIQPGQSARLTSPPLLTPATTTAIRLWLNVAAPGVIAGSHITVTQAQLERTTSWAGYFDGTTPDTDLIQYSWTGTANASASIQETRTAIPAAPVWTPDPPRTFNMGLRSREVLENGQAVALHLATDEALLQDYAVLARDTGMRAQEASLRAVCNYVLGKVGAHLEAGGPDANMTALWPLVNLHPNPRAVGTTLGYRASPSASGVALAGFGDGDASSVRFTANAGVSNLIAGASETSYRVTPGRTYVFSASIVSSINRTAHAAIQWLSNGGASAFTPTQGTPITTDGGVWKRLTVIATAPPGAEFAQPYVSTLGNTAGQFHYVDNVLLYEGSELVPYFDGVTAPDADYTYAWTGVAHTTASTRTPARSAPTPDAYVWRPGVTAWDILEPLTSSEGLRLYCDEARRWYLIDPATHTVPGLITLAGFNLTEGADTISREDAEVFATGVVVEYAWKDTLTGIDHVAYDVAGTPSKVALVQYAQPYPGPGAAAAILARRSGAGRTQDTVALADWTTTPGMEASLTLPAATQTRGKVSSVRFGLGDDALMEVGTRGLIDIPAGSWDAGPPTVTWDTVTGTWDTFAW
jgi:hypothetical protein